MTQKILALKVDVDTHAGTRDGVPALLEDLGRFSARATFYFSMGPDNTGKALRRIFTRKGFLKKALRSGAPSAYGIRTMLYGVLLPPPMIAASLPQVLRSVEQQGHEAGIHCWDHVKWHDYLGSFSPAATKSELELAAELFRTIMGHRAASTAAPGWTVSPDSLAVQDSMGLCYCSDSRGSTPFYPVMDGCRFNTLQIPTTLPTADEILGQNRITPENIHQFYLDNLQNGLNVLTVHAELEGNAIRPSFVRLLEGLSKAGIRCITLAEAAAGIKDAPACRIFMGELPGRAGLVALQGEAMP
ncbi:MAG TPA: polysaccharide deacetylase family protein [Deltaproteobacteria bacterium]|nr:polysaccharide deacetylase family protein [Deltaproteobacteria bacterium]HQB37679.1 polysaccharide deacetylase family protein [Deltaproteobacteria bacterium]